MYVRVDVLARESMCVRESVNVCDSVNVRLMLTRVVLINS